MLFAYRVTRKFAAAVLIYYAAPILSLFPPSPASPQADYAASAQVSRGADRPSTVAVVGEGQGEGEETLPGEAGCVACLPETAS